MPARSGCSGSTLSSTILTGTRWVTFTKLPEALSGGSRAKRAPVAADNDSMWPWIFYVNIPVGIMASIFTVLFIRDPERIKNAIPRPLREIDWLGIFLLILGVGSLQLVLEQGETEDWFESLYINFFTPLYVQYQ
jgi:hypothetical protein